MLHSPTNHSFNKSVLEISLLIIILSVNNGSGRGYILALGGFTINKWKMYQMVKRALEKNKEGNEIEYKGEEQKI